MGKWDIYDILTEEVETDAVVTEVLCGRFWTIVKNSEGGFGMALSTGGESRPPLFDEYIGRPVREVAGCMRSWNMKEAGVGMAAANSYFNTPERLDKYRLEQPHNKWCTYDLDTAGKKIVLVGHLRYNEDVLKDAAEVSILEIDPLPGDYPAPACEYIIPGCDILVISASALVNKTMPRLLELGKNAFTVITGPTAPMCERLAAEADIQRIAGFIPVDTQTLWQKNCIGTECSPYGSGRRFVIEKSEK